MTDHSALIEKLTLSARPVKRPGPTGWRVFTWLAIALPAGAAASLLLQRSLTDWSQPGAVWAILQLLLSFITGTLAMRNAFLMSIAGRRPLSWKWFAPPIALWLLTLFASVGHTAPLALNGEGTRCYTFMLVVSVPMIVAAIGYLRQTRALFPLRSLAAAGAGVACMALTLLSLCHPVHLHLLDVIQHLAAIATIVAATMVLGRRWIAL